MATGYTRQASAQIAPNLTILSNSFNLEFNKLQAAMDAGSGHNHDSTPGGGSPITNMGLNGLSGATGLVVSSSGGAFAAVQLTCTNGTITIGFPNGVGGNPVLNVNAGTGANQIVQLDSSGKLPAVDGSQLTNVGSITTDATNTVYGWENFI